MKIYPRSAFVVCDQKWTSQYEDDVIEINSIQVRFLEKIDGEWKISFVSFIGTSGYNDETEEHVRLVQNSYGPSLRLIRSNPGLQAFSELWN